MSTTQGGHRQGFRLDRLVVPLGGARVHRLLGSVA
jgi:hypothetical protein